jgi:hypothetical protein
MTRESFKTIEYISRQYGETNLGISKMAVYSPNRKIGEIERSYHVEFRNATYVPNKKPGRLVVDAHGVQYVFQHHYGRVFRLVTMGGRGVA